MVILQDIKDFLGITHDGFDTEILSIANSIVSSFTLMGLSTYPNIDEETIYFDHGDDNINRLVRSIMQHKTKTIFDPQSNVNITNSINNHIKELEYQLMLIVPSI